MAHHEAKVRRFVGIAYKPPDVDDPNAFIPDDILRSPKFHAHLKQTMLTLGHGGDNTLATFKDTLERIDVPVNPQTMRVAASMSSHDELVTWQIGCVDRVWYHHPSTLYITATLYACNQLEAVFQQFEANQATIPCALSMSTLVSTPRVPSGVYVSGTKQEANRLEAPLIISAKARSEYIPVDVGLVVEARRKGCRILSFDPSTFADYELNSTMSNTVLESTEPAVTSVLTVASKQPVAGVAPVDDIMAICAKPFIDQKLAMHILNKTDGSEEGKEVLSWMRQKRDETNRINTALKDLHSSNLVVASENAALRDRLSGTERGFRTMFGDALKNLEKAQIVTPETAAQAANLQMSGDDLHRITTVLVECGARASKRSAEAMNPTASTTASEWLAEEPATKRVKTETSTPSADVEAMWKSLFA